MNLLGRRKFLLGVALPGAAIVAGLSLPSYVKRIMAKNIEEMHDEYSMLQDIALRKLKLGAHPLIVKNADFRHSMDNISCENTHFIDCYFYPGVIIRTTALTNVRFEACQFMNCSFGNGVWENVFFKRCDGRKMFRVIGGNGSKNVVFEECHFMGGAPVSEARHESFFGGVGSFGETRFNDCDLKYVELLGASKLEIEKSRLNKVEITNFQAIGDTRISNSAVNESITVMGNFTSFVMKSVHFDYFSIEKFNSGVLEIEDCKGTFSGRLSKIKNVNIKNSEFQRQSIAGSEDLQFSGFQFQFPDVETLLMENVKFSSGGNLQIGGGENYTYDENRPELGEKIVYAKIKKMSILKTNIVNSALSYINAQDMEIHECELKDVDITHNIFEKLRISGGSMAGIITFANTSTKEFVEVKNKKDQGLNLRIPQILKSI